MRGCCIAAPNIAAAAGSLDDLLRESGCELRDRLYGANRSRRLTTLIDLDVRWNGQE